ncbi:MarR family winged helix-turn-helix transcriptional regulator [Mangrovicoccus sp. HB161399]|uniref:MarR family winged helix-turn-helix transcriptional regulator n=1 Tax=Mangrovicoccus sp. HB161399 TaxID=2720392 RepID=UPI00352D37C9
MSSRKSRIWDAGLDHERRRWPFFWISQVNEAYMRALERRIKPIGIDAPRWRAMMSLYEEDYLSISEIAELSAVKLNTTTKVVQRMIADGLVTTRVRPTDGRVTEVCLTAEGNRLRALAVKEAAFVFEASFGKVPVEDMDRMNALLAGVLEDLRKL